MEGCVASLSICHNSIAAVKAMKLSGRPATHVVAGKAPAPMYADRHMRRRAGCLLPGSKVVLVTSRDCDGAAEVEKVGGDYERGWLQQSCLRPLPAPVIAGVCASCRRALTQDAFTRGGRRKLRAGLPTACEACAAEAVERRLAWTARCCQAVDSLSRDGQGWYMMTAVVGASVAMVYLHKTSLQVAIGSIIVAACVKLWLLRCLGGFEGEPSLEEKPLLLVGEGAAGWERCVDDAWCRSFSSVRRCPFSDDDLSRWWQAALDQTPWQRPAVRGGRLLPRSAAWFVKKGCSCSYEYNATEWPSVEFPDWLLEVERAVWDTLRQGNSKDIPAPNSCVANFYEDGAQSVDWHADNEPLFEGLLRDCCIVSLSLGETRRFELRRRRDLTNPKKHIESVVLDLHDGDIITMEGCFQKHWYHRVPRQPGVTLPRINLTWRTISCHSAACPMRSQTLVVT